MTNVLKFILDNFFFFLSNVLSHFEKLPCGRRVKGLLKKQKERKEKKRSVGIRKLHGKVNHLLVLHVFLYR